MQLCHLPVTVLTGFIRTLSPAFLVRLVVVEVFWFAEEFVKFGLCLFDELFFGW